jgi:gliding motility-associated protein GldL
MSEKNSKFDIWWSSPGVKRKVGAFYSIGATVVIIGAMFKILHLPGAAIMLGAGMTIEAILFLLGVLDKPHKEYHWENVFDFDSKGAHGHSTAASMPPPLSHDAHAAPAPVAHTPAPTPAPAPVAHTPAPAPAPVVQTPVATVSTGLSSAPLVSEEDAKMLSEGIQNLTKTAKQLTNLADMAVSADKFSKQIDIAVAATDSYVKKQEALSESSNVLNTSYKNIADNLNVVESNTEVFAQKIKDINSDLASVDAKSVSQTMIEIEKSTKMYASSIEKLSSEFSSINISDFSANMDEVKNGTKDYAVKVNEVNKSLSSINSLYELQLKSIQTQSDNLTAQNQQILSINTEYDAIVTDLQKLKSSVNQASEETDKFKVNANQLSKSVAELNQVYGNMLNALN